MQATTVAARGVAESPYTVAGFSLSLSDKGTTVPSAKSKLKTKVEDLNKALEDLRTKLGIEFVKNSVRASSNVQEDYEYKNNKHQFVGYIVNYGFSFQIDDLDKVNEVYDTLTSLAEVKVSSPSFGLKTPQREKLGKKALKNAFAKATERFETECKVLNLNPNDFEISNWEVTYGDSQRGNRVAHAMAARATSNSYQPQDDGLESAAGGAGGGTASLELVAGLAEVVVNLEVGYSRRVSQTIKAQVVRPSNGMSNQEDNHV